MIKFLGLVSPVAVPLILAGVLFFSSEKDNRPRLYLAGYMLVIAYVFLANFFYFEHNYELYAIFHSLHIASVLTIYPGAYVYVILLVKPGISKKRLFLHFVPALIFFFSSALVFYPFLSPEERVQFLAEYRFNPDFGKTWMKIIYFVRMANIAVLFIQVFVYLFLTWGVLRKHRQTMADIFSNPEKFQLNWLRFFNISLALSAMVSVFLYSVNPARLFGDDRYLALPLLLIAIILWFLGIMGNNQGVVEYSQPEEEDPDDQPGKKLYTKLAAEIRNYLEDNKSFLNPELKIYDMARQLGTNRTYLSNTINQEFKMNFASLVNSYRAKEAMEQIKSNPDAGLKEIAHKVGFGSVSSLQRAFREYSGKSIGEFKQFTG